MGKQSKKIGKRRSYPVRCSRPGEGDIAITEEQFKRLQDHIQAEVGDKMIGDTLQVVLDMLDGCWGKMHRRATRRQKFGEIFKQKLAEQKKTHAIDWDAFREAGLVDVEFS